MRHTYRRQGVVTVNEKYSSSLPWRIVLAMLCAAAPIGVLLLLFKILSEARKYTGAVRYAGNAVENSVFIKAVAISKKRKHLGKALYVLAVVYLAASVFFLCKGVFDGTVVMRFCGGAALYCLLSGSACGILSAVLRRSEQTKICYRQIIGERDRVSLAELSAYTSRRVWRVRRDIQRLINDGLLGADACIDTSNQYFMRHPDLVADVTDRSSFYVRRISGEDTVQMGSFSKPSATGISEYDKALCKFQRFEQLIKDEKVLERVRCIESITANVFAYVTRNPEKERQIRRFMNFYLPTAFKLLTSYSHIEGVCVVGQNTRDTKNKIESALDTLAAGFAQQLDLLYRAENVDISSDIEVLQQMMIRDGLKDNPDFSPARCAVRRDSVISGEGNNSPIGHPQL